MDIFNYSPSTDLYFSGRKLPLDHFSCIINELKSKQKEKIPWLLGRSILQYFFSGESSNIFLSYKCNKKNKFDLKNIRKEINDFVKKLTGKPIVVQLEDYCHQQLKYHKEKLERRAGLHICRKCNRRMKNQTQRMKHEKTCTKTSLTGSMKRRNSKRLSTTAKNSEILTKKVLTSYQKGLEIRVVEEKRKGIFTLRIFKQGEYVCCYEGNLIDAQKAEDLENLYEKENKGCYMYFFAHKGKRFCIDATEDSNNFGRLINHSRNTNKANLRTRLIETVNGVKLVFFASKEISRCSELLYDYGERRKRVINDPNFAWLKE